MEKSAQFNRRSFIKKSVQATVVAGVIATANNSVVAAVTEEQGSKGYVGSIIDLTKCDGCANYGMPLCVSACKQKNEHRFPEPTEPIKDYWPQKRHEDYSRERDRYDRLTPYNWTYIEEVKVEHEGVIEPVSIPRRCMHCVDAPCQKLCPFGVISKSDQGSVMIDEFFCMGGAKCRDVCPWEIPQRQAGVGVYMHIAPDLAGGGVMYKCDMCNDLLAKGQKPACETACPTGAIEFGPVEEMRKRALEKAEQISGYVYGDEENGGTLTFYVSKVPFDKINDAIVKSKEETLSQDKRPSGRPNMEPDVKNVLDSTKGLMMATLIAPVAGLATAGITAYKTMQGSKRESGDENEDS
ncbi:4Fe-4S dicluster domain-containing protein [Desulfuribacillus alkaliarsenatis]|uniref:Oxidoreductase n=1 Tax=Desulfuribacillus alkaliarsenatis TaxID=766136 RepID=A0A1E5G320_9FIRM|nr:4Fe-4S dicluster domain-containing protein [Desulfuribacillus alkaliarsenatis]OEF96992.1 oxidoreductase [Desulfuribacillus alkaliarsenatis]